MPLDATPPVAFDTGLVRLHALRPTDWRLDYLLSRDSEVVRWTFDAAAISAEAARTRTRRFIARAADGIEWRYAIVEKRQKMGIAGFAQVLPDDIEVFYSLLATARHRGLATAAAITLTDWALQHGASQVVLTTRPGNSASEAVARRAGFHRDGTRTDDNHGEPVLMNRWSRSLDIAAPGH